MISRREFLQWTAVTGAFAAGYSGGLTRIAAQQKISQDDLLRFNAKGTITLLHLTDIHAQLNRSISARPTPISELEPLRAFHRI